MLAVPPFLSAVLAIVDFIDAWSDEPGPGLRPTAALRAVALASSCSLFQKLNMKPKSTIASRMITTTGSTSAYSMAA